MDFGVITGCQCRFINCNKITPVVGNVGNEGVYAYVPASNRQEISVTSPNSAENLKLL